VWQSFQRFCPEYTEICDCQIEYDWHCDLAEIDGFSASKSDLMAYPSIDAMAQARCQWLISEVTPERLAASLAHREIRIIHSPGGSDHFTRYLWDGRLWLMNSGGSHHTAAAQYLATRLRQSVPLIGTRYTYSLNPNAIASLCKAFEMFAIDRQNPASTNAFHDVMAAFRATWLWHPLPQPFSEGRAILLPRDESRSMRVAAVLREAGIADLGAHLAGLCERQEQI